MRVAVPTFLVLAAACTRVRTVPQTLNITYKPVAPTCYFSARPELPELKRLDYDDDDVVRRVFVHWLDFNAVVQYERDVSAWMDDVEKCVLMMTGTEP